MDPLSVIAEARLVPIVVLDDAEVASPLAGALAAGGLPIAEVTLRTPAALAGIERMAGRGDVLVGAGTVLNTVQADDAIAAGARFIVTPGLSQSVVERCREQGVPVIPGTVTATEITAALDLGVRTLKFFPAAASGGTRTIAALAAAFGDVRFVPTGGIGPTDAADYLQLTAVAALGGSWMVPRDRVAAADFAAIERLTAEAVALVAETARDRGGRP